MWHAYMQGSNHLSSNVHHRQTSYSICLRMLTSCNFMLFDFLVDNGLSKVITSCITCCVVLCVATFRCSLRPIGVKFFHMLQFRDLCYFAFHMAGLFLWLNIRPFRVYDSISLHCVILKWGYESGKQEVGKANPIVHPEPGTQNHTTKS